MARIAHGGTAEVTLQKNSPSLLPRGEGRKMLLGPLFNSEQPCHIQ